MYNNICARSEIITLITAKNTPSACHRHRLTRCRSEVGEFPVVYAWMISASTHPYKSQCMQADIGAVFTAR